MKKNALTQVRTDLALEAKNNISKDNDAIKGVRITEEKDCSNNINVVKMEVLNRTGANAIKKPVGTYITMEVPALMEDDEGSHREISKALADELRKLIMASYSWENRIPKVLVVGLGNREATSDALGPEVVSNLFITRHIVEFMGYDEVEGAFAVTSAIVPGVMAQTGMDTCEIISGIIRKTKPDILIAVDALAARGIKRLNSTIQITDTGIHPGSGVGNNRQAITKKSMGIPVIAIGVPTVVDASTLIYDSVKRNNVEDPVQISDEYKLMYVTSKDIDAIIKRVSYTISEGINICMGFDRR